jgi:hypothetical protein
MHHCDDGKRFVLNRQFLQHACAGQDRGERSAQIVAEHCNELFAQLGGRPLCEQIGFRDIYSLL